MKIVRSVGSLAQNRANRCPKAQVPCFNVKSKIVGGEAGEETACLLLQIALMQPLHLPNNSVIWNCKPSTAGSSARVGALPSCCRPAGRRSGRCTPPQKGHFQGSINSKLSYFLHLRQLSQNILNSIRIRAFSVSSSEPFECIRCGGKTRDTKRLCKSRNWIPGLAFSKAGISVYRRDCCSARSTHTGIRVPKHHREWTLSFRNPCILLPVQIYLD